MNPKKLLSLCMIVRNEEKTLDRCLKSLARLSPQTVVVDTGSQDSTVEMALRAGAEIFHFDWIGDFSAARNAALAQATGQWILVLDADEWLTEENCEKVDRLIHQPPEQAFYLVQKNVDSSGNVIRNNMVRLFPNRPDIIFTHKVHEDVIPSLVNARIPIERTNIEIEHSGYVDPKMVSQKVARNRAILESTLRQGCPSENEPHLRFNLGVILLEGRDITGALEHFEWCIRHSPDGSLLSRICQLRAADCYFQSGRFADALAMLPSSPSPECHPAALMLAAKIRHQRDPLDARLWLEALLVSPDTAHSPPVALHQLKTGAVVALGKIWLDSGHPQVARALLELAQQMKYKATPDATDLAATKYAQILQDVSCKHP